MKLVALFIEGTIKWVSKNIADALIKAGTATRVSGTKLTSAAADAARKNPITKASELPKSVIDATKKANTPKTPPKGSTRSSADRAAALKKGWEKRRANPSEKELQGRANVLAKQKAAAARKKRVAKEKAAAAKIKADQPSPPPKLTDAQKAAKRAKDYAEEGVSRNRENLDAAGIQGKWTGSVEQKKKYAAWAQNQRKIDEARAAAEAGTAKKISDAKQVTREPVTPRSQKGMTLPGKGETTGRKRGGTVGKKRYARGGGIRRPKQG